VTVQAWAGLHPKQQRHPGHGSRRPRPIVRGTILCVQVERVPARTRPPKVLWLWWAGPGALDLDLAWRGYVRRFDLEHTIRFCKQSQGLGKVRECRVHELVMPRRASGRVASRALWRSAAAMLV
jgi:hypothetical protein